MKFEKVSYEQFKEDFEQAFWYGNLDIALGLNNDLIHIDYNRIKSIYDSLVLPKRGTIGSAGYDFIYPVKLSLSMGLKVLIPTGIKWNAGKVEDRLAMNIYPRSGIGTEYKVREPNVVSVIDSDYYNCTKNEGHIFINLLNEGDKGTCVIDANKGYAQGIIYQYFITEDDATTRIRTGGFGSTNK